MEYVHPEALIEAAWLADRIGEPGLKIIDATWFMAAAGRDAGAEFEAAHIPGAVYFDIDDIADQSSALPHMAPDAETFAAKAGALGIGTGDRVIVYDVHGGVSAAMRAWWMFRLFGHDDVAVLDGGLAKWRAAGGATESGPAAPAAKTFAAEFRPRLVHELDRVRANIENGEFQMIDARPAGRFAGTEPEPRPGLKAGHIPGGLNVPHGLLVDAADHGAIRPARELARVFAEAGVEIARPIVASCGSGVTAAVLAFALYLIGHDGAAVYDGSWTEWGGRGDTPVET